MLLKVVSDLSVHCHKSELNQKLDKSLRYHQHQHGARKHVLLSASCKRDSISLRVNNEEHLYPVTSFFYLFISSL